MKIANAVLPLAYLSPVSFFSKYFLYEKVIIEAQENYNKQSLRNRCNIYSANGKLGLNIPITKGRTPQQSYSEVLISFESNWQKNHIRAIEAAYRHSPFFEFYWDDFLPLYQQKTEKLWDFNLKLYQICLRNLGLSETILLSKSFKQNPEHTHHYHFLIQAKGKVLPDEYYHQIPYYQVFSEKQGFMSNLSILDLIFNEGPNAFLILQKMAGK